MSIGSAVSAFHVAKSYGVGSARVDALRGVDLSIARGEFVALIGPSGSGKSTILHLIAGLENPTSGRIVVDGTDLGTLDENGRTAFRRNRIGIVFQSLNLIDILSAEENVAMPLAIAGMASAPATRLAREKLDRVGLSKCAARRPAELSGGEQQRVAIARALVADPPLIVADEPTGSLDTENGQHVFHLLRELSSERRSVILVTHDPQLARGADRMIAMRDGCVVSSHNVPSVHVERSEVAVSWGYGRTRSANWSDVASDPH